MLIGCVGIIGTTTFLHAQDVRLWKAEAGRAFIGEYGFNYEKKIFSGKNHSNPKGYYEREMYFSGRTPSQARPSAMEKAYLFFTNAYKKYYSVSAGYYNQDFTAERELYDAVFGRFVIKRYFGEEPPAGFYLGIGIGYQMYFCRQYNNFYETLEQGTIHRPSVTFPVVGYQWLLGNKGTFAVDAQIGADWGYAYQVQQPDWYQFQNVNHFRIFWGLSAGIVNYRRRSIW